MFWTIPAMCVQCWIEKFNQDCNTHQVLYTCRYYQKLSAAFSYFLFLFYFILQLLSIMHIFLSISKFVQKETSFPEYVMFSGFMLSLGEVGNKKNGKSISQNSSGGQVLSLVALTFTVESALDSVGNLLERTEERLLRTREKSERQKLKYEMRKLSKLQPMTGGGFFQITKSTLTSMLSVR